MRCRRLVSISAYAFIKENACKRATKAVAGAGVEAASNWMFGHMEDSDFNDPLPEPAAAGAADAAGGGGGKPAISQDAIEMLGAIGGFSPRQAEGAYTPLCISV